MKIMFQDVAIIVANFLTFILIPKYELYCSFFYNFSSNVHKAVIKSLLLVVLV